MDQNRYIQIQQVIGATHQQLLWSVDHLMPKGPAAGFWRWALTPGTPQCAEWLQLLGVRQLAVLTVGLLDGMVTAAEWPELLPYAARLNTYLTYEVVSDNLGIGCAAPGLPADDSRRTVLAAFNSAMIACLDGQEDWAARLFPRQLAEGSGISLAAQSLTAEELRELFCAFERDQPAAGDVDSDLWPLLVANIESAAMVCDCVTDEPFQSLVRSGLRDRYAGVNRLLGGADCGWAANLRTGRDTILVQPVLAYYAALFHARTPGHLDTAHLTGALQQAAILVRLLNDIGTSLLEMPDGERSAQVRRLKDLARTSGLTTLADLLPAADDAAIWTRLSKDLQFGEWNMAFPHPPGAGNLSAQLDALNERLHMIAQQYQGYQQTFAALLADLRVTPLGEQVASLTARFVHFHQKLYRQSFTSVEGEYASAGTARRSPQPHSLEQRR